MNRLPIDIRMQVISALVKGNSIRATQRMTGVAKNTIVKLLVEIGKACSEYQNHSLRNLPCIRLQCDEIRSFCHAREKNVPASEKGVSGFGDVCTWTAICADTKLVPSWMIGTRDAGTAHEFIADLASRMASRVQLSSDGHHVYLDAAETASAAESNYAMLVSLYGNDIGPDTCGPTECIGCVTERPDGKRGTSKKVKDHEAAMALHFMHYNFCRVHQTLCVPPAMAAGVTEHVWNLSEIVNLMKAQVEKSN